MNKSELAEALAGQTDLSKAKASEVLNALFDPKGGLISKTIQGGDKVTIQGFGTFQGAERSERKGVNPATKEPITIPASKSVRFKAGKNLKDAL